jgi:ABC-2 type transport system ATP-binding protein
MIVDMPDQGAARAADDGFAIRTSGLRKSYGAHEAVRGIDLEVRTGEVFGFLGANGAGKTTTLEILEGYRSRTAGEVSVLGTDPARPTRAWRDRIGLVLQECRLNPVLTVRETLDLYAGFYRRPRRPDEVIDLVGLSGRRDARIGTLSGGQQRRADVAVALIGDPDLVFLDEPTTGFDPSARRDAWRMIEGLRDLGTTVVLTTHYMDEAQHLSDRVSILRRGEIVATGAPHELAESFARTTTVTFRLPPGTHSDGMPLPPPETLRDGDRITLTTDDPQPRLHALLDWAASRSLVLRDLEVRRPSLEDLFLRLTGPDEQPSDDGDEGDHGSDAGVGEGRGGSVGGGGGAGGRGGGGARGGVGSVGGGGGTAAAPDVTPAAAPQDEAPGGPPGAAPGPTSGAGGPDTPAGGPR